MSIQTTCLMRLVYVTSLAWFDSLSLSIYPLDNLIGYVVAFVTVAPLGPSAH